MSQKAMIAYIYPLATLYYTVNTPVDYLWEDLIAWRSGLGLTCIEYRNISAQDWECI